MLMERTRLGFQGGGKGEGRNYPEVTQLLFRPRGNSPQTWVLSVVPSYFLELRGRLGRL